MTTNQFQPDRLRRLAYHLIRHQKKLRKNSCCYMPSFTDETRSIDETVPYYIYPMNEVVKLFPREWFISKNGFAYWIYDKRRTTFSSIMSFFGLYSNAFYHLFIPGCQNPAIFGGKILTSNATPNDIAENMLALIQQYEIQKN